jgi:uncharacterized protein YjbJ (UPF0337 family)
VDTDRIKGRVKEGAGKATGDKELEREGEAQVAWGDAKDKARDSWDKAKDAADDAKESVDKRV